MQSCYAPCTVPVSPEEYEKNVKKAALLLGGKSHELLDELKEEMAARSSAEDFERALVLRNEIAAIGHLADRQHVERRREDDQDVIAYQVTDGKVYLTAFNVERGSLANKEEFIFEAGEDFFEEFLVQYYSDREPPQELILGRETDPAIADFLSLKKGKHVGIIVPQRGEKRQTARPRTKEPRDRILPRHAERSRARHRPPHGTASLRDRVFRYLAPLRYRNGRVDGAVP